MDSIRDPKTKMQVSELAWEYKQVADGTIEYFEKERAPGGAMYAAMPVKGACLDVGGLDGRVRVFMESVPKHANTRSSQGR